MPSRFRSTFVSVLSASVVTCALAASPATAAPPGVFETVVDDPPGTWAEFDVDRGRLYSHDRDTIWEYWGGAWRAVIERSAPISGLSVYRDTITWLEGGYVYQSHKGGQARRLADISAYEARVNPDAGQRYGITNLQPGCEATVPDHLRWRSGAVASYPIKTVTTRSGVYVADYFGSTVLHVEPDGAIRTIAVLPPVTLPVDEGLLHLHALDPCTEGATAIFPRKPMDVDVDARGQVYLTAQTDATHHGTPGDGVYRVDRKGRLTLLASGFGYLGPLTVSPDGTVYFTHGRFGEAVMEIKKDRTPRIVPGVPDGPSTVDWDRGLLYVGIIDYSGDASASIGAMRPPR